MASRKLTDADKQEILSLYRQPGETTSTLADRYGVSNSTISRVLKQNLPEAEYSRLIQQKRSAARSETPPPAESSAPKVPAATATVPDKADVDPETPSTPAAESAPPPPEKSKPAPPIRRQDGDKIKAEENGEADTSGSAPSLGDRPQPQRTPVPVVADAQEEAGQEDDGDESDELDWDDDDNSGLDQDDYGDDDLDEDEEDLDDWDDDEEDDADAAPSHPRREQLEVLPFSDASFQRTYYLVVDRLSELITCPLRDFPDLGQIPEEEEQARTLPVFNNHRIARRFSRRNQRVVKVPDGNVIRKTQPYLQAKGITRLLLDGQVYSLH